MAQIHVEGIPPTLRREIEARAHSTAQLDEIRRPLAKTVERRRRVLLALAVAIPATTAIMLALGFFQGMTVGAYIASLLAVIVMEAAALGFAWYAQIGRMRHQFNKAVRTGYPELAERLKL